MIRQTTPEPAGPATDNLVQGRRLEEVFASPDADLDIGFELPDHLNTNSRRWSVLVLVAVSGAFASGPIASWPTLEPLLIGEGLWAGPNQEANLSSVYSIAFGVSMISSFVVGILYDAIGPRALGFGGAVGAAACLVGMAFAIKVPMLNNLMWVVYPAATAFGWANSMDAYAWLWLLPDDQATVAAVVGAIQCLSDAFCLLAVYLHDNYGLQLPIYFMCSACVSVMAGLLALVLVPPHREMRRISRAVTSYQLEIAAEATGQGYGAIDIPPPEVTGKESQESDSLQDVLSKSWSAIKDTYTLCTKIHPSVCSLFLAYNMAQYMFAAYPSFEMYPLYLDLVGTSKAIELVNIFGGVYAFIGAACILTFGKLVDLVGMVQAIALINVPLLVNSYLFSMPNVQAQVAAQVLLTLISNTWYVLCPRFCTLYAPYELFGTANGLISGLLGVGQIFFTRFGTWACKRLTNLLFPGAAAPVIPILLTIDMWCFFTVLASIGLILWWWYHPIPQSCNTSMAQVQDASRDSSSVGEKSGLLADCRSVPKTASFPQPGTFAQALPSQQSHGTCCSCLSILKGRPQREDASGVP